MKNFNNRDNIQKFVRVQILKARAVSRKTLFNNAKCRLEDWLVLHLIYRMFFRDLREVFNEIHILLTPTEEHKNVFG